MNNSSNLEQVPDWLEASAQSLPLTIFTGSSPMAKTISIADGKLVKHPPAMTSHRAERVVLPNLKAVVSRINTLTVNQAVTWGVHVGATDIVPVDIKDRVEAGLAVAGAIARSEAYMRWSAGPGVMMFDFDCEHTPEQARQWIIDAGKTVDLDLTDVEMIYRPSSSAGCHAAGQPDTALAGGRVYAVAEQAGDIPTIGNMLFVGLWLNGHGRIDASDAGTPLTRAPIDATVWQPTRLDFVTPAMLTAGVERTPQQEVEWGTPGKMIASPPAAGLRAELTDDYEELRKAATRDAADMLDAVRSDYIERKVAEKRAQCQALGMSEEDVVKQVEMTRELMQAATGAASARASGGVSVVRTLLPAFKLIVSRDKTQTVTVAEVLANPQAWNDRDCYDPLEPDQWGKAKIYTNGAPIVHSFKHGGTRYVMAAQARVVVNATEASRVHAIMMETLTNMRAMFPGIVYVVGDTPSYITDDGRIVPFTATSLTTFASRALDFETKTAKGEKRIKPMPTMIAQGIMEGARDRHLVPLPPLTRISDAPFIIPRTGEIVREHGYHAMSKTYLHASDDFPPLPEVRDLADAVRLAEVLVTPYADFDIYNPDDLPNYGKAVSLMLVLLAAVRAVMIGPNVLVTASRAGIGKTELTRMVIAEMGHRIRFTGWSTNPDEAVKCFVTHILQQLPYLAIENFDHPLGGVLEEVTDKQVDEMVARRILGSNASVQAFNNALVIANGIEVRPASEAMARRSFSVRLVSNDAGPAWMGKRMSFSSAPAEYVLSNWRSRRMAALALLKWGRAQAFGELMPRLNSMPNFDRYVRRLVHAVYGVDVFGRMVEDVQDTAEAADVASPKGRLFYLVWEMCRAHTLHGGDTGGGERVRDGKLLHTPIDEAGLAAGKDALADGENAVEAGMPSPWVMFSVSAVRQYLEHNNLANSTLDEILKGAKSLPAAGAFNGMQIVKTDQKDATKSGLYQLKGHPSVLPRIAKQGFFG